MVANGQHQRDSRGVTLVRTIWLMRLHHSRQALDCAQ
jgi:hypothetical protein